MIDGQNLASGHRKSHTQNISMPVSSISKSQET